MFPQAFLLHYLAYSTPNSGPLEPDKPLPFLQRDVKISRFGLQQDVKLAKLKGAYFPEALLSSIFSSKLDSEGISEFFLNLENHKISSLVPELRLYKTSNTDSSIKPFYFPSVSDYKYLAGGNMLDLSSSFTSNATAIENFSVTLTGKNPFQASRSYLEANLTVKLDNVATIFNTPSSDYAPIADLFTIRSARDSKPAGTNKTSPGGALENGKSCRIVATLGYAPPMGGIFTSKEKKIIKSVSQIINLYYSSHDLKLEQDGSASVSVKYVGYLEAVKGESQFDLISGIQSKARLQKAKTGGEEKKERKSLSETKSKDPNAEQKAKSTKAEEILTPSVEDIVNAFGEIVESLFSNNKIHVMNPYDASVRRFPGEINEINPIKTESLITTGVGATQDISSLRPTSKELENATLNPFEFTGSNYICYMAFGDILDAYYSKISKDLEKVMKVIQNDDEVKDPMKKKCQTRVAALKQELRTLNVLMGDILYVKKQENSTKPEQRIINIADIPVSIDNFYSTVFEEVTSPRKSFYDMNDFVTSMVPKLLTRSLGELPGADIINPVTFKTTIYTSKPLLRSDIIKDKLSIDDLPSPLQVTSKSRVEKLEQYIIIHQESSRYTRTFGTGDEEIDLENGIYHLRANQNSGIIKNITFSRIPSPAREAYMIVRNGKAYDELRYAHQASLEMVGNNIFFPGVAVYINPESLGFGDPRGPNSAARKLGFGGYYTVGPVTTTYTAGRLDTSATLYFESFPDVESQLIIKNGAVVSGGSKKNLKNSK